MKEVDHVTFIKGDIMSERTLLLVATKIHDVDFVLR